MNNNILLSIITIVYEILLQSWMDPVPETQDLSEAITLSKDQLKGNDDGYGSLQVILLICVSY